MNGFSRSDARGVVFKIIAANVVIFILQIFSESSGRPDPGGGMGPGVSPMTHFLGLTPALVIGEGYLWQFFSYMFLHSTHSFFHIFFNMYAILIFGIPIEQAWGSRRFLLYYVFCGTGAGVAIFLINLISGGMGFYLPTIGASGAVFGLLLAFGVLYPNMELLLFFFIPIKAKYLVLLYGGLELYFELFGGASNISHIGHLGGLFFGIVFFLIFQRRTLSFKGKIAQVRAQKKLNEYDSLMRAKPDYSDARGREEKLAMLTRVRAEGPEALSDDEYQRIKLLSIMTEDRGGPCPERLGESARCASCEDFDVCFLREIKRYL